MEENPFPGAAELAYKKSKKQLKREAKEREARAKRMIGMIDNVKCTCGAWQKFYTTLWYIHDNTCIINKGSTV